MAIFHHMAKNKDGLQLVQMETLQGTKEEKGAQGTSPTSQGMLIYDTPLCFQPIQLLDSPWSTSYPHQNLLRIEESRIHFR
jgi:hypothetical protein